MSRRAYFALACAAGVACVALRAHGRADDLDGPPPLPDDAGPIVQSIPVGAFVAEDESALASALADASGPAEIWLRARTYHGDVVIARRVALRGQPGTTLEGSGNGTVVTITADDARVDDVVVRHSGRRHTVEDAGIKAKAARVQITNVSVEDALFGITLGPCQSCLVDHSRVRGTSDDPELRGDGIKLWEAHDSVVRRSVMEDSRDLVVWYSRRVLLDENTVRRSRYGSHFMYAHDSIVRGSRIESNIVGIFVMYSERLHVEHNVLAGARGPAGIGIGFKESDGVRVEDNWIVANTTGAYLDRSPRSTSIPVLFERNVIALNDVGLRFHSSEEGVTFKDNDFHENVAVVEIEGGGDAMGTVFDGNHWSDYEGYDLDGDGRGDVAFEVKQLSGELTDKHPTVKLFEGTGAMAMLDTIARAAPVFASHVALVDPHPSMTPRRPR